MSEQPVVKEKKPLDPELMKQIKEHYKQVKADNSTKFANFKKYKRAFLLDWDKSDRSKLKKAKITLSTDPRNKVLGAVRLMVATDPQFNVKYTSIESSKDKIEKALTYIWNQSGRIKNMPIHYDALLSAVLYGEMHTAIIDTDDLVKAATQAKRGVERAERVAKLTPYLLEPWSPEGAPFERDILGVCGYGRETSVTVMQLKADFGDLLPKTTQNRKDYEKQTLRTWFDTKYTAHWIDDGDIDCEEHGRPSLPVCVQIVDGSDLFDDPEAKTQPLLYGVIQSDMWNRQNLALTVIYTLIEGMGISPIWKHKSPTDQVKPLDMNFDNLGGFAELVAGEDVEPMVNKGIIDPAIREGLAMATEKVEESTIREQALGAQVQGNPTFSALSLLSQSGRLPLMGPQKRGGWGIAGVAETILAFMKQDGKGFHYGGIDLDASEIPDDIQIEVKLEVNLPQDKLQLTNIARFLAEGEDPLADHEWIRENILNIGQSNEMTERVWAQKAGSARFMLYMQEQIAKLKAKVAGASPAPATQNGKEVPVETGVRQGVAMSPGQGENVKGMPAVMAGAMPGAGKAEALPPENPGGA